MGVSLSRILQLPLFEGTEILAGEAGADNPVRGIALLEAPDSIHWISERDLIITNAYFLNSVKNKEDMMRLLAKKKCAGMALKFNRYMSVAPDVMLRTGEELGLPLISLPYHLSPSQIINTVAYEIMHDEFFWLNPGLEEGFLKELLFGELDRELVMKKATMIGWQQNYRPALLLIWPRSRKHLPEIYTVCRRNSPPGNYVYIQDDHIIVVADVSQSENRKESALAMAHKLQQDVLSLCGYQDFYIGVGRCYEDFTNLAKSYYEARTAVDVARFNQNAEIISTFDDLGLYRILFDLKNQEELRAFYEETVARILQYDKEHNTEYLETVEVYLNHNSSIRDTAEAMYVHYNTIRYRLRKIRELVGIDLTNEQNRLNLMVGIQVAKFFMSQSKDQLDP